MYRLGQTSSTGVSPSLQESKMSCSSLMAAWSCCQLLLDIFSPAESSSNKPQHGSCCCPVPLPYHSVNKLTERHQQVVVWMQLSSKISSRCSACAPRPHVHLHVIQHCCAIDFSLFLRSQPSPRTSGELICLLFIMSIQNGTAGASVELTTSWGYLTGLF